MGIYHAAVALTADDGTSEVGSNEWNADHVVSDLVLSVVSPAQLTADQNDYAPTGWNGTQPSRAVILRVSTDAQRTITGLAGGASGRYAVVRNVGSNRLVLAHESASSTAANRFSFSHGNDVWLLPGEAAELLYDSSESRWRCLNYHDREFVRVLTADYTNSTTTLSDTALTFQAAANRSYDVELMGILRSNTATTGLGVALNTPASPTAVAMVTWHPTSGTALGSTFSRADNAIIGNGTSGVDTINVDVPIVGRGLLRNGANAGTVAIAARAEVTATEIRLQTGTLMRVRMAA